MWALSKLAVDSRDSALLDAVAAAMLPALPEFNAQNIANTVRPRVFWSRVFMAEALGLCSRRCSGLNAKCLKDTATGRVREFAQCDYTT